MRTLMTTAVLALFALTLGACGDDTSTSPAVDDTRTGTLALGVTAIDDTDAVVAEPALAAFTTDTPDSDQTDVPELLSLELTFDSLILYPGPGVPFHGGFAPPQFGHRGEDDAGEYVELTLDGPVTVNLLDLEANLVDLIGTSEIPAGDYRGVGLHLVEASATTVDSTTVPVVLPNERFEVLRVLSRFSVEDGVVNGLTLTIDVQSTVNSCELRDGELVLRPVLGNMGMGDDPRGWRGWDGPHGPGDGDGPHGPGDGPGDGPHGPGDGDGECDGDGPHGDGSGSGDCDGAGSGGSESDGPGSND